MAKTMVVHIDVETGDVIKVTDERGRKATEGRMNKSNPMTNQRIIGMRGHMVFGTQNSPTCRYYFYNGRWWRICRR